jgi:cytochrome P450
MSLFQHLTMFDAHDEKWRIIRKLLSPTFTSGKLKGMMEHMGKVADNMVECLREKSKQVFKTFSRLFQPSLNVT